MTDAEKNNWLRLFPAWPVALFNKFDFETSLQLRALNGEADAFSEFYVATGNGSRAFYWTVNSVGPYGFGAQVLNPSNNGYKISRTAKDSAGFQLEWPSMRANYGPITGAHLEFVPFPQTAWPGAFTVVYERGPYLSGATYDLNVEFYFDRRLYGDGLQFHMLAWPPSVVNVEGVPSPLGSIGINFDNPLAAYTGVESLFFLQENGYALPDIDYKKISDFRAYFNGYKKFSTEIETNSAYAKKKMQSEVLQYKADLSDKLASEQRSLQNLSLQIQTTLKSEASSAKRDYLNTFLQMQTLRQTLLNHG